MNKRYLSDDIGEFRYERVSDGIKVTAYTGVKAFVRIPDMIDGLPVTELGLHKDGYYGKMVYDVLIPATVKRMDVNCINVPSEVKYGYDCCSDGWFSKFSLEEGNAWLSYENGLLIEDGKRLVYCGALSVKKVIIPEGVEVIGTKAFKDCCELSEVEFPSTLKVIENYAFSKCCIKTVILPEGTESIGYLAFDVNKFTRPEIHVPASLREFYPNPNGKLNGLEQNKNFVLCDGFLLSADKKTLFAYLGESVTELVIPDCVESIAPYACNMPALSGIKKLTFGNSLVSIGACAFGDNKVKTIRIPANLTDIHPEAFDFTGVSSVIVDKNNPRVYTDKIALYSEKADGERILVYCFRDKIDEYTILDGTNKICDGAFSACSELKTLVLPDTLTEFSECSTGKSITEISLPASVRNIIFEKTVRERSGPRYINYKIDDGNPVYYQMDGVMYKRTDEGLVVVNYHGSADTVILQDATVAIAPFAFSGKIRKVILPASVRRIEHHAFYATTLEEITLNEGLETIDYLAFKRCRIKNITLPSSLRYICTSAFYQSALQEYALAGDSTEYSVCDGALYSKDMTVLYDVPSYRKCALFRVADSVVDIGRAFRNCADINEIHLPAGVRNIWRKAFYGCSGLKDLYFESSPDFFDDDCIDSRYSVVLHAEADSVAERYVSDMLISSQGYSEIMFVAKGTEEIQKLSTNYILMSNSTGLTVIKCRKIKAEVKIPAEIGGYKVTEIAPFAFANTNAQTVELPDTVEKLGAGAFSMCRMLKNVVLSKNLKKLSCGLFNHCDVLTDVIIPEGINEIEDSVFFGCGKLARISFPGSIEKISEWLFADNSAYCIDWKGRYKDLYLREETLCVVERDSYAEKFLREYKPAGYKTKKLNIVYAGEFSEKVSSDEKEAKEYLGVDFLDDGTVSVHISFPWGKKFSVIRIPATMSGLPVTRLTGMDSVNVNIEEIHIPASVVSVEGFDHRMFSYFGGNLRRIFVSEDNPCYSSDGQALYNKDKSVLIHMFDYTAEEYRVCEKTEIIEAGAFGGFENLKRVILPAGLREIRELAFSECKALSEIEGVENVSVIGERAFVESAYYNNLPVVISGTILEKYSAKDQTSYRVPEGVTEIAAYAFYVDSSSSDCLEEVILPSTLQIIGLSAFAGRTKLAAINLPEGLTEIGAEAFDKCWALKKLCLPSTLTEIDVSLFPSSKTSWRTVIPSSFAEISVSEENPVYSSADGVLYSKDGKTLIKVPANYPAEEFVVPESVESIGGYAFSGNYIVKNVILPPCTVAVGKKAFAECAALESINLDRVKVIDEYAFSSCKSLISVSLSAEIIGNSAFYLCSALSSVKFSGTKKVIDSAFGYCSSLKSLVLPEELEEIGSRAFHFCGFSEVVIPKNVKVFGRECFAGCREITVFNSVEPPTGNTPGLGYIGKNTDPWEEIIVKDAQTDEILYKVCMDTGHKYNSIAVLWKNNAGFNFASFDADFAGFKGRDKKIRAALNRLRWPVDLKDSQKESYIAYLCRAAKDVITACIDTDDMDTLLFCEGFGLLKKNNIDGMIEYAAKKSATGFIAYLMEYKEKHFSATDSGMFSLSFNVPDPWTLSKVAPGKVTRYKGAEQDVVFPSEVNGKRVTGIADTTSKVPDNYRAIVSVEIPEGYTTIGNYAFYGCENLEKITLPSTLESIGRNAFVNCRKLKEIIMPDSLDEIGENCFMDCSSLCNVRFSKKLREIPGYAFEDCAGLQEIDLPASVCYLSKGCFVGTSLRKVTFHSSYVGASGQCFSTAPEVYAYKDAINGVYGIRKRSIRLMKLVDLPSETFVTVTIGYLDSHTESFNFYGAEIASSVQHLKVGVLNKKLGKRICGTAVAALLSDVYSADFVTAQNNEQEYNRLSDLSQEAAVTLCIKEEKKNDDGEITTIYEYSSQTGKGSLKENERLGEDAEDSTYLSYYNSYYDAYSDDYGDSESDDGFVEISAVSERKDSGIWDFSSVETLEFNDKIVVLTGFSADEESEIIREITNRGGVIKDSVVLKTAYLIVMEAYDHQTTKYKKAKELQAKGKDIAIISSAKFYELINGL